MEGGSVSPVGVTGRHRTPDGASVAVSSLPRWWMTWATRPPAAWPGCVPAPSTSSRCAAIPSASTAPKRPGSGATGATPRPPPPRAAVSAAAHPSLRKRDVRGGPVPALCPAPGFLAKEPILSSAFPAGSQKSARFPLAHHYSQRGGDGGVEPRVPPVALTLLSPQSERRGAVTPKGGSRTRRCGGS